MPTPTDVRQTYNYDCGRACVWSVAEAFGCARPRVRCSTRFGVQVDAAAEALRTAGLRVSAGQWDEADLQFQLMRGRLVMVMIPEGKDNHWIVLYRLWGGRVSIHNPDAGRQRELFEALVKRWKRAGSWAVVAGEW